MDTQDTSVCHSTVLLVHHTILCILRSKDIAPRHGIAHGRTGRDNVHAPEAMTLPMCVKATGALGKKKAEEATRGHLTRRRPPCRPPPQAPTRTPIYQNRTAPTAPIRFAKQRLPPPPPPSLYSFLPLPSLRLDASFFSHRCRRGGGARRRQI
jgi:hypothetical protein